MKARVFYFIFGALPALALSGWGVVLAYVTLSGPDPQPSSMLVYALWPLLGVAGTISGCLVIFGVGLNAFTPRVVHTIFLALGILSAAILAWLLFPSAAALVPLLPVLSGAQLLRSLLQAAQPEAQADGLRPPLS